MSITKFLSLIFGYRKTNTSLLFFIGSLFIFLLYLWNEIGYKYTLPPVDSPIPIRPYLERSWSYLQDITFSFHPYTSRDNDRVHDYIWNQVNEITHNVNYAELQDDMYNKSYSLFKQQDVFNISSTRTRVIYFESSNILVKLEGKDPSLSALLLSSHFDSVPTSHGATDDGKGVASMLALLEYYSLNQPRRTLIFNFNNDEEFGLLGASHFLNHEWSSLVEYFINLEGMGTGSKAVMFRTSDIDTARIYKDAVKIQPFGNSIFQEGFNRRVLSSETDYKVYVNAGYRGWDIAFYKPRDLYHTKSDDIKHTSKEALWNMLFISWQLSSFLSKMDDVSSFNNNPAIYFDVMGLYFFTLSGYDLFIINFILIIVSPLLLIVLYILTKNKHQLHNSNIVTWLRLPFCVTIAIGFINVTEVFMRDMDPFIVFRHSYTPLFTLLLEFLLIILIIDPIIAFFWPDDKIKDINLIEITAVFWLVMLYTTISLYLSEYQNTGVYLFTLIFVGLSLTLFVKFMATLLYKTAPKNTLIASSFRSTSGSSYESTIQGQNSEEVEETSRTSVSNSVEDERAPLIDTVPDLYQENEASSKIQTTPKITRSQYEWTIQLVIIFLILLITYQSILQMLDATSQTVIGSNKSLDIVWDILFLGTIILGLLYSPFLNLRIELISLIIVVFLGLFVTNIFETPFTANTPLQIRFSQDLDGLVTLGGVGTNLGYIKHFVLDLPSFRQGSGWIDCDYQMQTCTYQGIPPNVIDWDSNNGEPDIMSIQVLRNDRKDGSRSKYEPIYADIMLHVKENRACSVYFNETGSDISSVKEVTIYEDNHNKILDTFKWSKGIEELQLHKLDFDKQYYHIGIRWFPKILSTDSLMTKDSILSKNSSDIEDIDKLGMTVICYWGEYDEEVIIDGKHRRKVPAFDELLTYAPIDYSFSNREKGMVHQKKYIEL